MVLRGLPPEQWAIVTSCGHKLAVARLKHVGISIPEVLISADDVQRGKPDPEGYLKAAKMLGALPEHCLVVELPSFPGRKGCQQPRNYLAYNRFGC